MESAFRSIWTQLLLLFVVLALCVGAFAQGGASELTGLVTDPTGAVVAGAPVKLTNNATGVVRTSTTTAAGTYRFPALEVVGTYTLEVNPKGFKSVKVQNIVPAVGVVVTRDVRLELGAATEQVTVEAGAQLVQTEDASLGEAVDRRVWQDMPLEDRSQNTFIGLLAGAEPAANAMLGTDRGAAVNGARSGSGNFMVDGYDNNDQGLGGGGTLVGPGGANTTISPDAIQEYRVIDNVPPAEYGKAGGFVTDTVLKSGTNTWHGSLFEYNRMQSLAANGWFSDHYDFVDHLVRNQFGGSIGGPIIKDRTFFYFTVEAHRLRYSTPDAVNTTTPDFVNFIQTGQFAAFMTSNPGGICMVLTDAPCPASVFAPNATLGPVITQEYQVEPIPLCAAGAANCSALTQFAQGLWTGGLLGIPGIQYPVNVYGTVTVPQPVVLNQMRYSTKVDHKLTSKDQLSGTYLYDNADTTVDFGGNGDYGPNEFVHGRAENAGLTWSHTFSPTILNQARMDYVRHTSDFPTTAGFQGMPSAVTAFDEPNFGFGMSSALPQFFTENEFIYKDDLSITHGKHNFKTGAEYRRTRNGSAFEAWKYGYNIFNDIEDLLTDGTFTNNWENYFLGGPLFGSIYGSEQALEPLTQTLPSFYRGYRANEVAIYGQDDWRIHPRLTLNLGLRWEYFGPPHNYQRYLDANFYTGETQPLPNPGDNPWWPAATGALNQSAAGVGYYASFGSGIVQQRTNNIWNKDLGDYGPRIGFSYDALGNQKVVVRAGFGMNYDRMYNNIFENLRFNPTPYYVTSEMGYFFTGGEIPITNQIASQIVSYNPGQEYNGLSAYFSQPLKPSLRAMDENLKTGYYEQAHFGLQYQVSKDMVLESDYVGTFGHRLIGIVGRNNYDGQFSGYDATPVNPLYGGINFRTNCCSSNYHGWQTSLRKRFTSGMEFNVNYTYSKAMDDISDAFSAKGASGGYPTDSQNPSFDYGPADFDVRHRIVGSWVYDLPFAKSNRWIGGWNVSGVVSWQTGPNFSITNSGVDSNADGRYNDRANYIGPGKITNAINHHQSPATGYLSGADFAMLNTAALPCPASVNQGLWCEGPALGQMEKNTLVGPGFFNTDFGIKKSFKITEAAGLRFEANFFNIFNHPNFQTPTNNLAASNFGQSTATFSNQQSGGPRVTQLALRFDF